MLYFIPLLFHCGFSDDEQGNTFVLWKKLGENKMYSGLYNAINLSSSTTKKKPPPIPSSTHRLYFSLLSHDDLNRLFKSELFKF